MAKPFAKLVARLKPKRRWAQFSLKSLLVVVAIVCSVLAVFGSLVVRSFRAREHRHSAQAVLALGGQFRRRVSPDMPISEISLRGTRIGDDNLSVLHGLPELQASILKQPP